MSNQISNSLYQKKLPSCPLSDQVRRIVKEIFNFVFAAVVAIII